MAWLKKFWKLIWDDGIKANPIISSITFIVVFSIIGVCILNYYCFGVNLIKEKEGESFHEIEAFLYWLTAISGLALAIIAYVKISKFQGLNEAEFLLRIDERWGDSKMVKARQIIHRIYRDIQAPADKFQNYEIEYKKIGDVVTALSLYTDSQKNENYRILNERFNEQQKIINKLKLGGDDFIILLNFLDFLETIGFLYKEGHITLEKVNAMCGESLKFHYGVFEGYIKFKQSKHNEKSYYTNFKKLYRDIVKEDCD